MGFKIKQPDGTFKDLPLIAGKTAYQVAVDNGFVGTEQQWLESLKGQDGAPGTPGTEGPQGPAGQGLVAGGTTGQVLAKRSETDFDTQWIDMTAEVDLTNYTTTSDVLTLTNTTIYTPTTDYHPSTKKYVDDSIAAIPAPPSLAGYATEEFVNTAVSGLVDTAPDTLNTLNELAAALGDDPNFATTIAGQIGGKADAVHTHTEYLTQHQDISGLATKTELAGKADTVHTHDQYLTAHQDLSSYATTEAMNNALALKADTTHTHDNYLTAHQSLDNYFQKPTELATTINTGDFLHVENDGTLKKISKDDLMTMLLTEITAKFTTETNATGGEDLKFNGTVIWTREEAAAAQVGSISTVDNTIVLDNIPAGTYILKYEDENGTPLEDYEDITTMEVQ